MDVLITFRHGLGDAVQLTAVLEHLRHYHPDWQIDVAALAGKESTFYGQCRRAAVVGQPGTLRPQYDETYDLRWAECPTCHAGWPSSKAERCLLDVFHVDPIPAKCRYTIHRGRRAMGLARRYLEKVCRVAAAENGRYPVVLIHYEGNTSAERKNLPVATVRQVCEDVIARGMVPVILDWDCRSPLPDGERIHCPGVELELWGGIGTGDAEVLAALCELSSLVVGVDSGPLHVAGATSTPTIGVWTGHHPLHYFSHADNVVHLVPQTHQRLLRGDRRVGREYFARHYRYRTYDHLEDELRACLRGLLGAADGALVFTRGFWIRSDNARQDLVIVQDIAEEDSYEVEKLPMPRPVVVDVGAHIGVFSQTIHRRNPLARVFAVECCPENIAALAKNVGGFATVIQAAVSYEDDLALLNAVYPGCVSTGGSTLVSRKALEDKVTRGEIGDVSRSRPNGPYWADFRPIETVTLEQILQRHGLDRIDVLKLDCEGSEFSILRNTTLLDRIGVIVGEYHGKDRFLRLVGQRFAGWELRILRDGELGTFWLRRKVGEGDSPIFPSEKLGQSPGSVGQSPGDWIFLYTPMHTGTHFVRLLLELHPWVSFWKCGRTCVDGKSMNEWYAACRAGRIRRDDLVELGIRCREDFPDWSRSEAARLGIPIPPKTVRRHLVQAHVNHVNVCWPTLQTVVTLRDPLLSVISALRRGASHSEAEAIVSAFEFLASIKPERCFWFCTDLWAASRRRALDLLDYLGLEPTPEIEQFADRWPVVNETSRSPAKRNDDPRLVEARHMAADRVGLHPAVAPWAKKIRRTRIQPLLERLGYRELVWFE